MKKPIIYRWEKPFTEQIMAGKMMLSASLKPGRKITSDIQIPKSIVASLCDVEDLYPLESILVTADHNKPNLNDILFPVKDTYAAKDTPVNKPINLNHEDLDIVGHMTSSIAVDDNYKEVAADCLPDKIHLETGGVLYRHWRNANRKEKIEEIISEIQDDLWSVSMECLFYNFDYALKEPGGVYNIVNRCDDTSYLTKFLRFFGGEGSCDGCDIAMAPRDFIFSGKGLTKDPANPESKIISMACRCTEIKKEPEVIGEEIMADKANVNLEADLASANVEKEEYKVKHEKATAKVGELEAKVAEGLEAVKNLKTEVATLTETVKDLTAKLNEVTEVKSKLEATVTTLQTEKLTAERISTLVDGGIDKAEASALASQFANLTAEQFESVAAIKIEAIKAIANASKEVPKPVEEPKVTKAAKEAVIETEASKDIPLTVTAEKSETVLHDAQAYFKTRKVYGK